MIEISQKALQRLKEENISPKPKWYFQLNDASMWVIWGVSIVLGSIASGIVIFQLVFSDWDISAELTDSFWKFLILSIPYFWLIFLAAFCALAYHYFRQTRTGYKHHALFIVLTSIALSLLGGGVLYASGLSEKMEHIFTEKVPFYEQTHWPRRQMWLNPDRGLLTGRVTEILDGQVRIQDPRKRQWIIDQLEILEPEFIPQIGEHLNLRGQFQDGNFIPQEIRPFMHPQMMKKIQRPN